jgi:hypothetical protein
VPTPEAADLVRLTRTLAERELAPRAAEAEAGEHFPREVFRTLGAAGLLALPYVGPLPRLGAGPAVTLGARHPGPPALLAAAARELGAVAADEWCLLLGSGGVRKRAAFLLFADAGRTQQVVKFTRQPGNTEAFDREEQALRQALAAGPAVADRAPRLLARGELAGVPASVETAMPGVPLRLLRRPERLAVAEDVAHWLGTVGRFQHGDLTGDNVLVDGGRFGLVDWEHARADGLPLADLLFFAAHVLPGRGDPVALFLGRSPESPRLFRWVQATGLSRADAGRYAAQAWQEYGERARASRLAREQLTGAAVPPYLPEQVATAWRTDPGLGEGWPALDAPGRTG